MVPQGGRRAPSRSAPCPTWATRQAFPGQDGCCPTTTPTRTAGQAGQPPLPHDAGPGVTGRPPRWASLWLSHPGTLISPSLLRSLLPPPASGAEAKAAGSGLPRVRGTPQPRARTCPAASRAGSTRGSAARGGVRRAEVRGRRRVEAAGCGPGFPPRLTRRRRPGQPERGDPAFFGAEGAPQAGPPSRRGEPGPSRRRRSSSRRPGGGAARGGRVPPRPCSRGAPRAAPASEQSWRGATRRAAAAARPCRPRRSCRSAWRTAITR